MNIKEIIHDTDLKMKKTAENTHREFSVIRTGRASASVVVQVGAFAPGVPSHLYGFYPYT